MFKIGDWVVIPGRDVIHQVNEKNLKSMPTHFYFNVGIGGRNYLLEEIKKWQPDEGEWCWMWDTKENLQLRQYGDKTIVRPFKFIEPFIGELPTPLRKQ